MKAAQLREEVN